MTAITWIVRNLVDINLKMKKAMIRWISCTDQRPTSTWCPQIIRMGIKQMTLWWTLVKILRNMVIILMELSKTFRTSKIHKNDHFNPKIFSIELMISILKMLIALCKKNKIRNMIVNLKVVIISNWTLHSILILISMSIKTKFLLLVHTLIEFLPL